MNIHAIGPNVLHVEEDYRVYCTLVKGDRRAILWDTGQGKQNLKAWVGDQGVTDCLVLNSHGHADHVGGNARFPAVYLHGADWPLLYAYSHLTTGAPPQYEVLPLEPDAVLDLGGTHARVVPLTGHTWGSVGLLLEEERVLLAGDGLNPTLLLVGKEAAPLSRLRETLEAALDLPFDHFLASHTPSPLGKSVIEAHLQHLDHPKFRPLPGDQRLFRSQDRSPLGRSVLYVSQGNLTR